MVTAGFDGTVNEAQWSQILLRAAEVGYRHGVWSGGNTTVSGRTVSVTAFDSFIAGIWHTTTSTGTLTLPAVPAGTNKRIDYIVAEANWNATATALGTPANSVQIQRVAGGVALNPAAPNLTQNAGDVWQMPLARITDTSAGATVEVCKPLPRVERFQRETTFTLRSLNGGGNGAGLATLSDGDPGWPYRIKVEAAALVQGAAATTPDDYGYARMWVSLDGSTAEFTTGRTANFSGGNGFAGGQREVRLFGASTVRTGPVSAQLLIQAVGMDMTNFSTHAVNRFELTVIPA